MVMISSENLYIRQSGGATDTYPLHCCEYVSMTRKIANNILLILNISSIKSM